MMSNKGKTIMKRWMVAICLLSNLSLLHSAEYNNLTQAFEQSPRFKEYDLTLKSGKQDEAIKIKREILVELTQIILNQYYSELSNRSREWVRKKIETYPLQMKTILSDLYLKSDRVLEPKEQKIAFNAGMFLLIDAIHNGWGNSEVLANGIKTDFKFNDWWKFINELVEIGKSADKIAQYRKEIADSDKKIADSDKKIEEWKRIIERLNKL